MALNMEIAQAVEKILEEIRPSLQSHGGDAHLVAVEGDIVKIELEGACNGCPMSAMTFGVMVDEMIKERLPQIKEVVYE